MVFLHSYHGQYPSVVKSYTSTPLSEFLGVLFAGFLSRLLGFFGARVEVGGVTEGVFVPFSCQSTVMAITAEGASLSFTVSRSTEHGLPPGLWCQHEPWHSLSMVSGCSPGTGTNLSSGAAQTTGIWVAFGGNTGYGQQHIHRDPSCSRTIDSDMATRITDINMASWWLRRG